AVLPAATVIRPLGTQYGYPDPHDPGRFLWVFLGGVEVEQPGRRLLGDTLVLVLRAAGEPASTLLEPPAGEMRVGTERLVELYLDGNVRVEEGDERISGASAFHLDASTGVATVVEGELRAEAREGLPLVARFALLQRLQDGTAFMRDLTYTDCDFARPHWHVRTPYARLASTPEGPVLSTGPNVVNVGSLPVLWLPGVDLSLDGEGLLLSSVHVGTSSRFGTELETRWKADVSPLAGGVLGLFGHDVPVDADFDLGLSGYSKRGVLFEPAIDYHTRDSFGRLETAFIHDSADEDHLGQPIEDHNRGGYKLEHRTRIDEQRTLDIEASYQSDSNFLNEYDEREAKEDKPQETYVSYRDVVDNHAGTALVSTRLNDHQTQAVYYPELALRQAGEALPWGFFMTAREFVSQAALKQADGSPDPTARDLRAGVDVELARPWDLPNGDRVQFLAQVDLTGFEDTVDDGSALRTGLGAGLEWSRTYSGTGEASSETWNLDGLRRIVEPRVGFFDRFEVSKTPDELLQIDQVEQLDQVTVIELGLRDRIQTHQEGAVATLLDTDVSLPLYPRESRDNSGDTYGPLRLDTLWRPRADLFGLRRADVRWRTKFDANDAHYTESYASYSTDLGEGRRLGLSQNQIHHEFQYRTIGLGWKLNDKWDVAVFYQRDVLDDQTARSGILLRQIAHCWYIDLELSTRQATEIDGESGDEVEVALRLTPAVFESNRYLVDEIGGRIP
ncbi:MAG TPA: hypothetical protein VFD43_04535, partial [Planctomycetota bacterium]|nr:hypothetical protein [Planctomycetota bacterium]